MTKTRTYIDPLSTRSVLDNFALAIDEIKIVRAIDSISRQAPGVTHHELFERRRNYVENELRFLKKRLNSLRKKAELNTQ